MGKTYKWNVFNLKGALDLPPNVGPAMIVTIDQVQYTARRLMKRLLRRGELQKGLTSLIRLRDTTTS